jgi:hypothetical protein
LAQGRSRAFCKVLGARSEYHAYLARPEVWDLWELAPAEDALATCSVAAVTKRSSDQLRKILMVVPFNEVLQDVPSMLGREPEDGLLAGGGV